MNSQKNPGYLQSFYRCPITARLTVYIVFLGLYAAFAVLVDQWYLHDLLILRSTIHTLLGLVLGGLLVFRTNTAYDRWWEGRKLWGQLVNDIRNLAIKVQACVQAPLEEKRRFAQHLIAFPRALRDHLRGSARLGDYPGFEATKADPPHVPMAISHSLYHELESWRRERELGAIELLFLDQHAASLMNICGACERILKTPLSPSWRRFIRQSITIYLITLPWGLVKDLSWFAVPTVMLVSYFMIGMETTAEDVEQPFGLDADDLPLDDICATIEKSVNQALPMNAPVSVS
jgi:ion channel-forming bestrophin family protein